MSFGGLRGRHNGSEGDAMIRHVVLVRFKAGVDVALTYGQMRADPKRGIPLKKVFADMRTKRTKGKT
jgi:hypothetical protein